MDTLQGASPLPGEGLEGHFGLALLKAPGSRELGHTSQLVPSAGFARDCWDSSSKERQ